jgi:hypothetical protein
VDFRAGVSYPLPWGVTFGASLLLNDEGSLSPTYLFNSTTRYPDGSDTGPTARFVNGILRTEGRQAAPPCPTDFGCVPGSIVAPTYQGTAGGRSVALSYTGRYDAERLKQLDIKFSKTFRTGNVTIAPTLEVFNITNQDKIITHVSASYASAAGTYLQPNSILQGRMVGWGARVAW